MDRRVVTFVGLSQSGTSFLFSRLVGQAAISRMDDGVFQALYRDTIILNTGGVRGMLDRQQDIGAYRAITACDMVVNVVDATRLEESLQLTLFLAKLNVPMIVAISKNDRLQRRGLEVDVESLTRFLRCPVVQVWPKTGKGLDALSYAVTGADLSGRRAVPDRVQDVEGYEEVPGYSVKQLASAVLRTVPRRRVQSSRIFQEGTMNILGYVGGVVLAAYFLGKVVTGVAVGAMQQGVGRWLIPVVTKLLAEIWPSSSATFLMLGGQHGVIPRLLLDGGAWFLIVVAVYLAIETVSDCRRKNGRDGKDWAKKSVQPELSGAQESGSRPPQTLWVPWGVVLSVLCSVSFMAALVYVVIIAGAIYALWPRSLGDFSAFLKSPNKWLWPRPWKVFERVPQRVGQLLEQRLVSFVLVTALVQGASLMGIWSLIEHDIAPILQGGGGLPSTTLPVLIVGGLFPDWGAVMLLGYHLGPLSMLLAILVITLGAVGQWSLVLRYSKGLRHRVPIGVVMGLGLLLFIGLIAARLVVVI